jgi:hypothetical protein
MHEPRMMCCGWTGGTATLVPPYGTQAVDHHVGWNKVGWNKRSGSTPCHAITPRIRELAKRYAEPLPRIIDELATLAARVDAHIKRMGASWT